MHVHHGRGHDTNGFGVGGALTDCHVPHPLMNPTPPQGHAQQSRLSGCTRAPGRSSSWPAWRRDTSTRAPVLLDGLSSLSMDENCRNDDGSSLRQRPGGWVGLRAGMVHARTRAGENKREEPQLSKVLLRRHGKHAVALPCMDCWVSETSGRPYAQACLPRDARRLREHGAWNTRSTRTLLLSCRPSAAALGKARRQAGSMRGAAAPT